jgi:hypothetical protein
MATLDNSVWRRPKETARLLTLIVKEVLGEDAK